jgi:ribulose-phosphate 3-epimerase
VGADAGRDAGRDVEREVDGVLICPSILSADFAALGAAIDLVAPETDWVHVDVMDGHFVPNLTIGPPVVKSLRAHTNAVLDCHLMITDPASFLPAFAKAGATSCTVHVELGNTSDLIKQMRDLGLGVGIVANPDTPFASLAPHLGEVDVVLIMSVFPGFGGQRFIPEVLTKVAQAAHEIRTLGSNAVVQIDGGIDSTTAQQAAMAGARAFVAGNAIFAQPNPLAAAAAIRAVALEAIRTVGTVHVSQEER